MTESKLHGNVDNDKNFKNWLDQLYNTNLFNDDELLSIYEELRYKNFDRNEVLKSLYKKFKDDPKSVAEIVIACALNGPNRASKIILKNGNSVSSYNIPASGAKGTKDLSCSRITAGTADLAAFYLKKLNVPKRMSDHELPAWLQFPAAAAIKMPDDLAKLHLDFCKKFSEMIKVKLPDGSYQGGFNEAIYSTIRANSYLDPRLKLFN